MCREEPSRKPVEADFAKEDREHSHYTEYRNNAQKVLKLRIDTTASNEECRSQITKVVQILCPFMIRGDGDCTLHIKPLTGGLSNHLFLVSHSDFSSNIIGGDTAETDTVMVRIHPDGPDGDTSKHENNQEEAFSIIDRECETKLASWLALQREDLPHSRGSMAPTMYGRFENGRVEEFYSNVRPLAWAEMKTYAPWIAQSMASFHSLGAPPEDVLPRPTTDDGTISTTINQTMHTWLKEAHKMQLDETARKFLTRLSREWDWLESILAEPPQQQSLEGGDSSVVADALAFIRRVTITHMDCQPLNILINDQDDEKKSDDAVLAPDTLRLIDFEYSGWNPIAADIANTFCEYCEMSNLCADYDKEYPTPAQQDNFFWHYLLHADLARAKNFSSYSLRQDGKSVANDTEWRLFSETLQREVGRFTLLSHLGWAIWSVIKAEEEDGIDFDYLGYARHRMDGFAWSKKKFCVA